MSHRVMVGEFYLTLTVICKIVVYLTTMTENEINTKLEEVIKSNKIDLDKQKIYNLRHRSKVGAKLEVLWKADKLKFK